MCLRRRSGSLGMSSLLYHYPRVPNHPSLFKPINDLVVRRGRSGATKSSTLTHSALDFVHCGYKLWWSPSWLQLPTCLECTHNAVYFEIPWQCRCVPLCASSWHMLEVSHSAIFTLPGISRYCADGGLPRGSPRVLWVSGRGVESTHLHSFGFTQGTAYTQMQQAWCSLKAAKVNEFDWRHLPSPS